MGFLDKIFKQKWKDEDPQIRLEAVKKLGDEEILINIAQNDSEYTVRREAVKKINDQSALKIIAKNDSDYGVCEEAVKKINDESFLLYMIKTSEYWSVREASAKRISEINPQLTRDPDEIENITDEEILIKIAESDINPTCRSNAIKKINNEKVLINVAKNDSDIYVRCDAIENPNLSNVNVLKEIFNESSELDMKSEWNIQYSIIKNPNFNNQSSLIKFIKNNRNANDCAKAIEKITHEKTLIDIALHGLNVDLPYIVRARAASNPNLKNQATLNKLANDTDSYVVCALVSNPNLSIQTLEKIANDSSSGCTARAKDRLKELSKSSTENTMDNISSDVVDYYCENCFTDIPESEFCPHCGSINVRKK